MYQPGGAERLSFGIVAFSRPVAGVNGTSTSRCVPLNECVVSPGRIRFTHLMRAACAVRIVTAAPYVIAGSGSSMTGREPVLNRYGGLKISSRISSSGSGGSHGTCEPLFGFPPAATTRPSGNSRAME